MQSILCDRCKKLVRLNDGLVKIVPGSLWQQFSNEGESVICYACLHGDKRYLEHNWPIHQ